jgi:DNA-binding transcriptional ArsR family regulator
VNVIELVLQHSDLARVRFAQSPVWELAASLRTLHDRSRHHMHSRWVSSLDGKLASVRMDLLVALTATDSYLPDFLTPSPLTTDGMLDHELARVRETDPAVVRAHLDRLHRARPVPRILQPLYEDPRRHLATVVAEMRRYWQVALEPHWPQLRACGLADVAYRLELIASGGIAGFVANLHPEVVYDGDRLMIRKACHRHQTVLRGSGIWFMPSLFSWPSTMVVCCDVAEPSISYPMRGTATVLTQRGRDPLDSLQALVGSSRAALLTALASPRTTTDLAHELKMSPAAVSQHLKILKQSGLAASLRRGRSVFYQRTAAAGTLLAAADALQATH